MKKSNFIRLTGSSVASFMATLVLTLVLLFSVSSAKANELKKPTPKDASTELTTSEKNITVEHDMEVENWMTDLNEKNWYESTETTEEVEDWMVNIYDDCWCTEDTEEVQEMETWMLTPQQWL